LSAIVTGLGAVAPALIPGESFPANPPAVVTAPVAIAVNGQPAEVITAVGWPGTPNYYRVDFRIPDATSPLTTAVIRVSVAWMWGAETTIPLVRTPDSCGHLAGHPACETNAIVQRNR
jgi:uncharacterized protein (TIGR03437 family)